LTCGIEDLERVCRSALFIMKNKIRKGSRTKLLFHRKHNVILYAIMGFHRSKMNAPQLHKTIWMTLCYGL
jgi:hypothetical protein